jgi:hypothetical protein
MSKPVSPYHKPGFYDDALARGRHRDIVGGRWDETGRLQMTLLREAGLLPGHHLLDIGAGCLRLGCKAVPYLDPGHYWATDLSGALMQRGHAQELADPSRLPPAHLIEDPDFAFAGLPPTITHAIAFALFTHLPLAHLARALYQIHTHFPALESLLFTAFLAPEENFDTPCRQPDGVVTHALRAPYHHLEASVLETADAAGFACQSLPARLPRGQVLFHATRMIR